eukprot:6212500-Pleurochrysis_carterae.AAC.4
MHAAETTWHSWTNSSAAETSGGVREEGIGEVGWVAAIADGYTRRKQRAFMKKRQFLAAIAD